MKNRNIVFSNLIWRFSERCGAQFIAFVVSVILARILSPSDYGMVSLISVFTTILQVFVDSGLGNALIQAKYVDDLDFSTIFYTNVIFCVVLYGLVYACAPIISDFYGEPSMTLMVRILSITVLISGLKNVQQAYVSRNMMFKKFFFSTLGGTVGAAIVGIIMAYSGFGVWALVIQQVLNVTVDTIILWFTVKWRPRRMFSFERLKKFYSFGWKLLVSSLLETVYNNLRSLIIGKMYSSSDLAYYNQGQKFPSFVVSNISASIDSVLFPALSSEQDNRIKVKMMTRRSLKISIYIMAPLMMGLAFVAEPLVRVLLTDKWIFCVPYLRIFCITYMFYPLHTANLNAIKALGRSDWYLKLEILKKIIGMILLFGTMWFGVMIMAYSLLLSSVLSQIINSWPNRKLLDYGYLEQLKDILPNIILAIFMGICIKFVEFACIPDLITLIIQIILGVTIYVVGSIITHNDSFLYLWNLVKQTIFNKIHWH